jgi:hypothetical protein
MTPLAERSAVVRSGRRVGPAVVFYPYNGAGQVPSKWSDLWSRNVARTVGERWTLDLFDRCRVRVLSMLMWWC